MPRMSVRFDVVFEVRVAGGSVAKTVTALPSSRGMRVDAAMGVEGCGGFSVVGTDALDGRAQKEHAGFLRGNR